MTTVLWILVICAVMIIGGGIVSYLNWRSARKESERRQEEWFNQEQTRIKQAALRADVRIRAEQDRQAFNLRPSTAKDSAAKYANSAQPAQANQANSSNDMLMGMAAGYVIGSAMGNSDSSSSDSGSSSSYDSGGSSSGGFDGGSGGSFD